MKKLLRLSMVALVGLVFAGLTVHMLVPNTRAKAAGNGVLLTGMVKAAQGEKMAGVTVSARADGSDITTSVFTDADGNYFFPRLAEGNYRVWAQATGYDAGRAEVQ